MPADHVLSIDAGTTGVTVGLFDRSGNLARKVYSEFGQVFPQPGWVEHDAEEIWEVTARLCQELLAGQDPAQTVAAIGITNQRETTVIWDRETGQPFANAIVWQCRRTAEACEKLKAAGHGPMFQERTGLVLDAYFSGTKVAWLLENVPAARAAADQGRAAFGTIDTWLIHRLTGGQVHATDPTNASRTLMYDIGRRQWDEELCGLLGVPMSLLPEVRPSAGVFGVTSTDGPFGCEIPIAGVAGDQQAALFGQGCVTPGSAKNTYGTGCFMLVNCGNEAVKSKSGLVTTLACGPSGEAVFALEGSVFIGGAVIQWLRDELGVIESAEQSEALARSVDDSAGITVVPAFVGLGAPYWDMHARGAILGITRGANKAHIVRAALESIALQTRDLLEAMRSDVPNGIDLDELRVDGGAVRNDFLMEFQADVLGIPIRRPHNIETTAQGAAWLAGLGSGFWPSLAAITSDGSVERTFEPRLQESEREALYDGWKRAIQRVQGP